MNRHVSSKQPPLSRRLRVLARAMKQFPSFHRRLMAEELSRGIEWHGARILVEDHLGQYYSIYSPCPNGDHFGVVQRTHKIFDHHAHAPYCRRENQMFISAAKSRRRLLDIGAAEGFYSALFAAVVGQSAEIVSVDPMDHNWTAAGHLEECRRINVEKNRCA